MLGRLLVKSVLAVMLVGCSSCGFIILALAADSAGHVVGMGLAKINESTYPQPTSKGTPIAEVTATGQPMDSSGAVTWAAHDPADDMPYK